MTKYPLIESNSAATLFDRITVGNDGVLQKANHLTKKLIGPDGREFIYTLVIIESDGGSGSYVDIQNISINNDDGSNVEGENSRTTETQDGLFCATPLRKTALDTWTPSVPFMGTIDSSYNSSSLYTQVLGVTEAGQDYMDAATGAECFVKIGIDVDGNTVMLDASETTGIIAYIPVYSHDYIAAENNEIPAGHYAAFLIKCDVTLDIFDAVETKTLNISHNAVNTIDSTINNYAITLSVTGVNAFELELLVGGSSIATEGTAPTVYSRMMPIQDDLYSGLSWPTSYVDDNVMPSLNTASAEDGTLPVIGGLVGGTEAFSDYFSEHAHQLVNNQKESTIQAAFDAGVSMFTESSVTIRDNSVVPGEFQVLSTESKGDLFSQSTTPFSDSSVQVSKEQTQGFSTGFAHSATSSLAQGGNMTKHDYLFVDFSVSNATKVSSSSHAVSYLASGGTTVESTSVDIPYVVYPLFTYSPSSSYENNSQAINRTVTAPSTNNYSAAKFHEHSTDVVTSFDAYSSSVLSPSGVPTAAVTNYSTSPNLIGYHNVRINCLSTDDEVERNGFEGPNLYSTASIVARATTADAINKDGTALTGTTVPSVADQFLDYTIESTIESNPSLAIGSARLERETGGEYVGTNSLEGFVKSSVSFKAPITSWRPGAIGELNIGTDRIPFFHSFAAPYVELSLNKGYYQARPLLQFGWNGSTCSPASVSNLEFIGNSTPSTAADMNDGLFDYGNKEYTLRTPIMSMASGTNVFTHDALGANAQATYLPGVLISRDFSLAESMSPEFPHVGVAQNLYFDAIVHAGDPTTPTSFTVVNHKGLDVFAQNSISGVQYLLGKPKFKSGEMNTSFVHNLTTATIEERDRIANPYGSDLSWSIKDTVPTYVKAGDSVIINDNSSTAVLAGLQSHDPAAITAVNDIFTATSVEGANPGGTKVDIFNFDPKESGITLAGAEISSKRFKSSDYDLDCYPNESAANSPMFYSAIASESFLNPNYSTELIVYPFNEGEEDVLIRSVEMFEPYYLPSGVYSSRPYGSNVPTWSAEGYHTGDSLTAAYGHDHAITNPNSETSSPASYFANRMLPRNPGSVSPHNQQAGHRMSVNFNQETNADVAGDYYQVLEVSYYRDVAATQKYHNGTSNVMRAYGDRPLWKTRKLIKINIDSASGITVSDSDENDLNTNGTINFGTINA